MWGFKIYWEDCQNISSRQLQIDKQSSVILFIRRGTTPADHRSEINKRDDDDDDDDDDDACKTKHTHE